MKVKYTVKVNSLKIVKDTDKKITETCYYQRIGTLFKKSFKMGRGTCKLQNEIDSKRNRTKRNETNETELNITKNQL